MSANPCTTKRFVRWNHGRTQSVEEVVTAVIIKVVVVTVTMVGGITMEGHGTLVTKGEVVPILVIVATIIITSFVQSMEVIMYHNVL